MNPMGRKAAPGGIATRSGLYLRANFTERIDCSILTTQETRSQLMEKLPRFGISAVAVCLFAYSSAAFAQTASDNSTTNSQEKTATSSLRFSTGISYSKGSYGEIEDTEVFAIPLSVTLRNGPLKVRVSVPWVWINGPGSLISTPEGRDSGSGASSGSDNSGSGSSGSGSSGSGSSGSGSSGSGSGGSGSGSGSSGSGGSAVEVEDPLGVEIIDDDGAVPTALNNKRNGFGDVNIAITYSFDLGDDLYFEPTAKVKIPTGSRSKRLGTGQVDVTLSSDLVKSVGNASFYVHGRRKFAGKAAGSTIRSTWGTGGGASVRAGDGFTLGADYDWQQSAFIGRKPSSEVTGWANMRLAAGFGLTIYGSTGLNSNSADVSGGATVSVKF